MPGFSCNKSLLSSFSFFFLFLHVLDSQSIAYSFRTEHLICSFCKSSVHQFSIFSEHKEHCCLIHHFFYFRVPASALSSHPLVLAALSSLSSEILSEASVNGTMNVMS